VLELEKHAQFARTFERSSKYDAEMIERMDFLLNNRNDEVDPGVRRGAHDREIWAAREKDHGQSLCPPAYILGFIIPRHHIYLRSRILNRS
jgi:hypothetical protein